jgi:thiamine biosynthesis lipoprotein
MIYPSASNHFPVCLLAFLLSSSGPTHAADPALTRFTFTEPNMGTEFKIILYATNQAAADKASKAAFQRVADLDLIMSDYRSTSELMRLCQKAGGDPVKVSDDLFFVLSKAEEVSKLSDGAFDVTVGPIVKLWRLSFRTQKMPDKEKLAKALDLVGYQKVHLDAKAKTVMLDTPGMQLDLGGIAKGYAADEALAVLQKHGITRALVAASGDIAVSGPPPDAEGWTIAIAPLDPAKDKHEKSVLLHDAAVSTSGDAEKYVEIDGKRYSHIVDPRTGLGLTQSMSVTVIARRGITADSMTKIVCVLGPEKGMPLIDKVDGVAAFMVRKTESGLESLASTEFKKKYGIR